MANRPSDLPPPDASKLYPCRECGTRIPRYSRFCPNCGLKLHWELPTTLSKGSGPNGKKTGCRTSLLVIASAAFLVCALCPLAAILTRVDEEGKSAERSSRGSGKGAAPVATQTTRPTLVPSPTIDARTEAEEVYAQAMEIIALGDESIDWVKDAAAKIAAGRTHDMVGFYNGVKRAAENWEKIKFGMYGLSAKSPEVREALRALQMSASTREDAYRTLLRWIDTQKTSDMALSQEQMEQADEYLLLGIAKFMTLTGAGQATPTAGSDTSASDHSLTISARDETNAPLPGEVVNLWDDYEKRTSVVAKCRDGEIVKLVRRSGDGVLVETADGIRGWVTYWFIAEYR